MRDPLSLTPAEIVRELDRFIVGQRAAKRAVAVALRNRYRRQRLPEDLRDEVLPKNILMIGPTGVGKTEIARRLARMVGAPFMKVEATKFTEVGYVGRDVDSIIRDLVETAIRQVKAERVEAVQERAAQAANERIVEILVPSRTRARFANPFAAFLSQLEAARGEAGAEEPEEQVAEARRRVARQLAAGELEDRVIEVEVADPTPPMIEFFPGSGMESVGVNLQDFFGGMLPKRRRRRRLPIREARKVLAQEEAEKLIDMDEVQAEGIRRAEQNGMVFIDEIDKIAGRGAVGPDVSREGVQRDILPIVEGSTVMTKYGPVKTDHILFIAAGAFHVAKPSDLIPELQGRFPIRVELEPLTAPDFRRILTEPQNALIKQYQALMATEGITLRFEEEAIDELASLAQRVNEATENIGARRLHTLLERLLEDLSFSAPEIGPQEVTITRGYVQEKLAGLVADRDLSRYIL